MLHIFLSQPARRRALRHDRQAGARLRGARLVDEDGAPTSPDGEIGELWCAARRAADGYWNQREKSAPHLRGRVDAHRRQLHRATPTAITATAAAPTTCSRSSGIWVSPFEVEAALIAHPAVLEAAVVGRGRRDGLIKPKAFVVLQAAAREADERCASTEGAREGRRSAPWKYPRWIEFVDGLPKTATGKIQRFKLRRDLT